MARTVSPPSFRTVSLGVAPGDGAMALVPTMPSSFKYKVSDTLGAFYHAAGFGRYEQDRLRLYFAARAQWPKYELRCRLVAFLAGAAAAETVGAVVERRRLALQKRVEANIARNPRMPGERQAVLREEAESESEGMWSEVDTFRSSEDVAQIVTRLPSWAARLDVMAAALKDGGRDNPEEGALRGSLGQDALQRWGEWWRAGAGGVDIQNAVEFGVAYEARLVPSKGCAPMPQFMKAEVDGLFVRHLPDEAEEGCTPVGELVAIAEAKFGHSTLYDDIPRMSALLDYLSEAQRASTFVCFSAQEPGQRTRSQQPIRLPESTSSTVEVHYIIKNSGTQGTLHDMMKASVLTVESGRMLKHASEIALRGDSSSPLDDVQNVFELLGKGSTDESDGEFRVVVSLPDAVLAAASSRAEQFASDLWVKVQSGQFSFWICDGETVERDHDNEPASWRMTSPRHS